MTDYLYDGTYDGFLTCLYQHFAGEAAENIMTSGQYQLGFTNKAKTLKTNEKQAAYMYDQIQKHLGLHGATDVYYSYLSQVNGWEGICLSFVDLCFREGARYKDAFTHQRVYPFYALIRKVKREVERYLGYVRFRQWGDCLYSKIHPEYFILPALDPHFTDRYAREKFIIHDADRNLALISKDGKGLIISFSHVDQSEDPPADPFVELWQRYVKTTAIQSRINLKLQQQFVPLKYRKDLVEMEKTKDFPRVQQTEADPYLDPLPPTTSSV